MKEKEMETIANLIADILISNKDLDVAEAAGNEIRKSFQKIQYCFD